MVAGDKRLVDPPVGDDLFGDRPGQFGGNPPRSSSQMNVQPDIARHNRQRFIEGRDLRSGEPGRFPRSEIKRANLVEREVEDMAGSVARPVDRPVVHDDHLPVFGEPDVELDHLGFHQNRRFEGGKGVFRKFGLPAAVGADPPRREVLLGVNERGKESVRGGQGKQKERAFHGRSPLREGCRAVGRDGFYLALMTRPGLRGLTAGSPSAL